MLRTACSETKVQADSNTRCATGTRRQVATSKVGKALYGHRYRHYVDGYYTVNGRHLYVNRGLGFGRGTPMPRLGSEPELALITLRAG